MLTNLLDKKILRYQIVGAIGACFELALFSIFASVQFGILWSNFAAFHFAFILCFILHYFYTHENLIFKSDRFLCAFIKYVVLMYTLFFFGTILLWLFIERIGINVELAKFLQIGIITPFGYLFQKYLIFKK